jgi:hypothetical protein
MRVIVAFTFVIAANIVAIGQSPVQKFEAVTDPDAYAIYAALVPQAWANLSQEPLLLQQETENMSLCSSSRAAAVAPEWQAVENNFRQENIRPKLLQPLLPISGSYRLIPRAEIEADDARLAVKYPGRYNRRPESMEYAAVSAVGYSADKTKAVVYMRLRSSGGFHSMERRDDKWVTVYSGVGCAWIA